MTSKKFRNFILGTLLATIGQVALCANAPASGPTALPTLYYVGVIPAQWEKNGPWRELAEVRKVIDTQFAKSARSSKRFSFLNDDLVRSLWSSDAGRRELESDYEISAFLSLDVSARGDMIVMTTRLLSPKLQTRLQESEVISKSSLATASKDQLTNRLTDLVLRMINRLPIDAHITSVNGGYATLSAGTDQGIKVGDKFDVLDASVTNLHPVTGGWMNFNTSQTGTVEVVEVKSRSAIVKITGLTKYNSVKMGHGIRIEQISGRSRFASTENPSAKVVDAVKVEPAVGANVTDNKISPVVPPSSSANQAAVRNTPADTQVQPQQIPTTVVPPSPKDNPVAAEAPPVNAPVAENETKDGPPETDSFTARILPKGSQMRTFAGIKMWSISGSATAKASLPVWLVNAASADIYRDFSDTIDFNYGAEFGFGPTGDGSFFSYTLKSAGRWHMYMKDVLPGADDVNFGLMASFSSSSIRGETSGGFDLTMLRFTMGVSGWAKPDFIGEKIEWSGEVYYPLYYSGQFGIKGKFREIISGSSMAYRVGLYVGDQPTKGWQYGAAFDFEDNSWSLKTNKKATQSAVGLLALARRNI